MSAVLVALELLMVLVIVDVLLAWVQEDPSRWPRRLTHALTEPALRPLRTLLPVGDWDLSAVAALGLLALAHATVVVIG